MALFIIDRALSADRIPAIKSEKAFRRLMKNTANSTGRCTGESARRTSMQLEEDEIARPTCGT